MSPPNLAEEVSAADVRNTGHMTSSRITTKGGPCSMIKTNPIDTSQMSEKPLIHNVSLAQMAC